MNARLVAALADRYRVERELGAGGMATVYLAHDLKHDRRVALKVLKPELAAVLGAERFVVEIKTTAALQHPHILPLFDSGSADGFLFYVMPYIEGETLRGKLDRESQLGIDEAVRITREVADALDYAHRQGVIHRDIKPENILLHDGRPMVADFGIALALSAAAGGRMTETGMSLGTPHYMSPEQATADKEISGRSDIYSLGSVLYEMLAGEPPHVGHSAQQIIMKIIAEPAEAVTKYRKSVPPNVAAAVAKSLEKLPADRFETARVFSQALADPHFTTATTAAKSVMSIPGAQRRLTLVLGLCLAAMTLLAGWGLFRPTPTPPVSRYALAMPGDQLPADNGFVAGTSDGSRLIYMGAPVDGPTWQLRVKDRDRVDPVALAGTEGATAVAVSADDREVVFIRGTEVIKMPILGGSLTTIGHDASNRHGVVTWLDDGTIVYLRRTGLTRDVMTRIDADGGHATTIWSSDSLIASMLTPLPGGRGVLFGTCKAPCTTSTTNLWVLDLRNDSAHVVQPEARVGFYVRDGYLVFVGQETLAMAVPFDLSSLRITGTPRAVTDTVSFGQGTAPIIWVAPDGGTLAMQRGSSSRITPYQLVWVDQGGRITPIDTTEHFVITQTAGDYGWSLSPDGRRVAIGVNTSSGDDIWIKTLPQGPMSKATHNAGADYRPRWRPDGEHITFASERGVFIARADGTGRDSLVWPGSLDEGVISPDGRWLLVRRGATGPNSGGRDILGARLGIDTALVPVVATASDEMAVNLSPDGRWLAYQSDETGRLEVYVRPFPVTAGGGRVQVSARGGSGPLWARNGRTLYYRRSDNTMMAVGWPLPADGQIPARELFHLDGSLLSAYVDSEFYTPWDVAADGRFLMIQAQGGVRNGGSPLIVIDNWREALKMVMKQ